MGPILPLRGSLRILSCFVAGGLGLLILAAVEIAGMCLGLRIAIALFPLVLGFACPGIVLIEIALEGWVM